MPVLSFPCVVTHHDGAHETHRRRTWIKGRRVHLRDPRVPVTSGPRLRELRCEYRPMLDTAGRPIYLGPALRHSGEAAALLSAILCDQPVELIGVLCLTVRRQVLCWHLVARGGIDGVHVDPRVVFQAALVANADAIILAHNHPSGDPAPSLHDMDLTRHMIKAGDLLRVKVLDHIIIGDGAFASVRLTTTFPQRCNTSYSVVGSRPALGAFARDLAYAVGPLVCPVPRSGPSRRRAQEVPIDA